MGCATSFFKVVSCKATIPLDRQSTPQNSNGALEHVRSRSDDNRFLSKQVHLDSLDKFGLTDPNGISSISNGSHDGFYEDPDFPAQPSSLFFSPKSISELESYTWKRPYQLSKTPQLYVDGTSRRDVLQGSLGDCWLLSTCAAVAKREDLLHRVISPTQVLFGPEYTGLIRLNMWRFGKWQTIIIDDRLPQRNGKYCYSRCLDENEFWVALLEKAVAKMHGSYEAIEGGMPIEAMVDLTGGLAERYELSDSTMHRTLYRYLRRSFASQAFITCSRKGDWRQAHKADQNGLVQGHAYTITGLFRVNEGKCGKCHLIRVRNPWGDQNEWKGPWSDNDANWKLLENSTKQSMGFHNKVDGEFWMDFFSDFCHEFEEVSICTLGPDFDHDGEVDKLISSTTVFGEWIKGQSAGGSRNNLERFATNPQFRLDILEAEKPLEEGSRSENSRYSQLIISLSQEHQRCVDDKKMKLLQIGFCLYGAKGSSWLNLQHFKQHKDLGTSGPYINYREVFARFELLPGSYIIIPATFESNIESNFMVRVFSGAKFSLSRIK
ncbi:calpain clp-1-like [Tigriopus californicus]|uniref:calpain clp-1-like n=1 Tax=Tigriopus californicus TaxID=6832 RepID=UPI0027DA5475|nr:calpain clp-1-like [Tigriopus californicus]